ncbi:MAG TPA: TonB-dependent receptor [Fibrobacteria bacterium]|nr:TonB-dependent receptor [Fibrobacteria bacterium]
MHSGRLTLILVLTSLLPGMAESEGELRAGDLSLNDLMGLKISSAAKVSQSLGESPAVISVITAKQIQARGYLSVGEALEDLPGFDLITDHGNLNFGVRGINSGAQAGSRIIKVMIDYQPVSFRPTTENWLGPELIPMQAIEKIEVNRSPASALYGANAYLGVVNIITKDPSDARRWQSSVDAGWSGGNPGASASGAVSAARGDWGLLAGASLGYQDRSGLRVRPIEHPPVPAPAYYGETSKNDLARPRSGYLKLQYHDFDWGAFTADASYQRIDANQEFWDADPMTHETRMAVDNAYARLRYQKELPGDVSVNVSGTFAGGEPAGEERWKVTTPLVEYVTRDVGYRSADAVADLTWMFGSEYQHSLIAGGDMSADGHKLQTYYEHYAGDSVAAVNSDTLGRRTFLNTGAYAQLIIRPIERIDLTGGLRYDRHNIYGDVLNYRGALVAQVHPTTHLKLLYSTSYKAPASAQLFSNPIAPQQSVLSNAALKPEEAEAYEVALFTQLGGHLQLQINGFRNSVRNLIAVEDIGLHGLANPQLLSRYYNSSSLSSWGGELEGTLGIGSGQFYLGAGWQRGTSKAMSDSGDARLYPEWMLSGGGFWLFPRRAELSASFHYNSGRIASIPNVRRNLDRRFNPQNYSLAPAFLCDAGIATDRLRWLPGGETRFQLKVRNLLGAEVFYPGFRDYDIPDLGRRYTFTWFQSF